MTIPVEVIIASCEAFVNGNLEEIGIDIHRVSEL